MEGRMTLHWEGAFDSAHWLYEYKGKCSRLHGHRWNVKVDIAIDTMEYPADGISVDFNVLKTVIDSLDHRCLNNDYLAFEKVSPSAENIVQYLAELITEAIKNGRGNPRIKRLEVFETPNNSIVLEY